MNHTYANRIASNLLYVTLVTAFVLLSGCARAEVSEPATKSSTVLPGAPQAQAPAQEQEAAPRRQLIRRAQMHVEVDNYSAARRSLEAQLATLAGYVEDAEVQHASAEVSVATLTLRVPAASLDALMAHCTELGSVLSEQVNTEDVSEQYYDTDARRRNAQRLEARLLELLTAQTSGVKDLLEVERELARVRQEIETLDARLRVFDGQVAMSTLTLRLSTRDRYAAGAPLSLRDDLSHTLGDSWTALVSVGRFGLVSLVALLPWIPLGLVVVYLGRRLMSRRGRAPRVAG